MFFCRKDTERRHCSGWWIRLNVSSPSSTSRLRKLGPKCVSSCSSWYLSFPSSPSGSFDSHYPLTTHTHTHTHSANTDSRLWRLTSKENLFSPFFFLSACRSFAGLYTRLVKQEIERCLWRQVEEKLDRNTRRWSRVGVEDPNHCPIICHILSDDGSNVTLLSAAADPFLEMRGKKEQRDQGL